MKMTVAAVKVEGGKKRLVIDYKGSPYGADLAQYPQVMQDVIDKLREVDVDEVVLSEYYERIYKTEQTNWLKEIADVVSEFEAEGVWSPRHLSTSQKSKVLSQRHDAVLSIVNTLRGDPFKAYIMLATELKAENQKLSILPTQEQADLKLYIETLEYMLGKLGQSQLIQKIKDYLQQLGSIPSDRGFYQSFFEAQIKPSFIGSQIFFTQTDQLELVDQYRVLGSDVYIYRHPDKVEAYYFINPPEYSLPPDKYFLLEKTKEVVAAHRPENVEFLDMTQARRYFKKVYDATISDLASRNNLVLSQEERTDLAEIVARYTIGYGILEVILSDRKITDVYVDSPLGMKPISLVHSKYGQCQTNIIFSGEEARSIVSRFRALSGRPFDEAHPILDFDLPDLQTRVAVIGKPLATDGIAFAFRLHKETPWTLAQFVDGKMMDSFSAGLLSMFVDAQASQLIVGSRGSGKTSLLQAMMLELPQNLRIIVQEDSVVGESSILVERNGKLEFTTVGKLIDGLFEEYGFEEFAGRKILRTNPDGVKVFSATPEGKIVLAPVSQFTRHEVQKDIFEVETRSGRKIRVTGDHSLFTLSDFGLSPVKTNELKPGDYVAVPRALPVNSKPLESFDAMQNLLFLNHGFVQSPDLIAWIRANRKIVKIKARSWGYHKSTVQNWVRRGLLPIPIFRQLVMEEKISGKDYQTLYFKLESTSKPIPTRIVLNDDFLAFAGLWLADGCYDGNYATILSVDDEESRAVVRRVAESLGLKARFHSDGVSLIISNKNLNWMLRNVFRLNGDSYSKKLPDWVFQLSKHQLACILKGMYSGDGHASKSEVLLTFCSEEMISQVQTLLHLFGIVARKHYTPRDKAFHLRIGQSEMLHAFKQIGFLQNSKAQKLEALCMKTKTHDTADVIPLSQPALEFIAKNISGFNKHDYLTRGFKLGRAKLAQLVLGSSTASSVESEYLNMLAHSEIYWDEVKSVTKVTSQPTTVYDFSVPGCENFVCENIIAHNTLELPVPAMKKLGYNIQRLKTRQPLGVVTEGEVAAEDALRTALRLGDSVRIVGEVRSKEALALYEAMRIGAVGNVVMGTIHGESAYSIWDRVVNDLGVPSTSFKATDFVVVTAPIRFKGSLQRKRRLIEVTEVKKEWTKDPLEEKGFLNWLSFDATRDKLDFFEEKMGDSQWISKVKKFRGLGMEELFNEVRSRGETKQYLVDVKNNVNLPELLEAENTVTAHAKYMLLAEKQREENGSVSHPQLLGDWKKWVDDSLVKELLRRKGA